MKMNNVITYKSKRKGFTLAELLIVVAITVIIAGVSIPLFATFLNKYQLKQVKDLETAAKAAAVSAFYSGYDSKGNAVKIYETGACTFLYDAENSAVYVLNYRADIPRKIHETVRGFTPLKEHLPIWIEEKLKELNENEE